MSRRDRRIAIYYTQVNDARVERMHLIKFASCHHAFAPAKYENGFVKCTCYIVLNAFSSFFCKVFFKHKQFRAIKSKSEEEETGAERGLLKVEKFFLFLGFHP
jgi:hypothetical protein